MHSKLSSSSPPKFEPFLLEFLLSRLNPEPSRSSLSLLCLRIHEQLSSRAEIVRNGEHLSKQAWQMPRSESLPSMQRETSQVRCGRWGVAMYPVQTKQQDRLHLCAVEAGGLCEGENTKSATRTARSAIWERIACSVAIRISGSKRWKGLDIGAFPTPTSSSSSPESSQ